MTDISEIDRLQAEVDRLRDQISRDADHTRNLMSLVETGNDAVDILQEEIAWLRQGLWDCARLAGADLDGDDTPEHLTKPDIVAFAHRAVLELAGDYDLALMEITSLYQELDWQNFTKNGKVAPLGEDADDEAGRGC